MVSPQEMIGAVDGNGSITSNLTACSLQESNARASTCEITQS
ncbi:hypothetical protein RBSWK_01191 [Rhodopirellula baltica SWK14]|uniref:Uncharacterized protein n=1 Tax=Rhodopirellula baltica SWK14 TaxID=993516 RepID=L7CLP9_RHOBT|nr:hypothetical protein RBSWK_01191 [Rhodopirellula baltica SWK14]